MKLHEKLSILFSGIAIIVSSIAIYFQFFHVNHTLVVSSTDLIARPNGSFISEFIVSNTGNRTITISNIHFCLIDTSSLSFSPAGNWTYIPTNVNNIYSDIVLSESITSLKADDIKVLRLNSKFDLSEFNNFRFHNNSFYIGIAFTIYTSDAKQSFNGIMPFFMSFNDKGEPVYPQRNDRFEKEYHKIIVL